MDRNDIWEKYTGVSSLLLSRMNNDGYWTGCLSVSALSTAVAIVALKTAGNYADAGRINDGFSWLIKNINADGGYGDTKGSVSNVSTTLLCYAAVSFCQEGNNGEATLHSMEKWLAGERIIIDPESITPSILKFYGKDYTFSVPILSMLHLCGVIPTSALRKIPALPYELTLLPSSFYRFFNMRVVSYALPALIGVGIYLQKKGGRVKLRNRFISPAISKLSSLVPESGGFLEAIPLTGFVAMCLKASGEGDNLIVRKGIEFLRVQQRDDGAWPIDTDLSTWVTTLSIKAFGGDIVNKLTEGQRARLRNHLLALQYRNKHPFNGADPGGWGWTSFSGSVPDADDTPGAILALLEMYNGTEEDRALENGCRWLMGLQNSDGGFPTFCRGWGRLPFDSSCADLTGHALLALLKTRKAIKLKPEIAEKTDRCINRAIDYLTKNQSEDGSWLPLWFGNQLTKNKTNPIYGTAKVCTYLNDCMALTDEIMMTGIIRLVEKARSFLMKQQNTDGSWGGEKGVTGSIEETALAICALAPYNRFACLKGLQWLAERKDLTPAPIGLYFALLWYDEELYPVIYYTEALRRFLEQDN